MALANAVQQAQDALAEFDGDVLILYGDVLFMPTATMQMMFDYFPPGVKTIRRFPGI